jgi:hypothetical protein
VAFLHVFPPSRLGEFIAIGGEAGRFLALPVNHRTRSVSFAPAADVDI